MEKPNGEAHSKYLGNPSSSKDIGNGLRRYWVDINHFLKDVSFMKLFLHPYSAMIIMSLWLGPFANVGVLPLTPCILLLERFSSPFRTCNILLEYLSLNLFMMRWYRAWKSYLKMQQSPHSHQVVKTYSLHIIEFALRWKGSLQLSYPLGFHFGTKAPWSMQNLKGKVQGIRRRGLRKLITPSGKLILLNLVLSRRWKFLTTLA